MANPSNVDLSLYDGEYENWREILAMLDGGWTAPSSLDKDQLTPALTPGPLDFSSPDFSSTQDSASPDQSSTFYDASQDSWSAVTNNEAQSLQAEDWAGIFNWDEIYGGASTTEGFPKGPQLSTSMPVVGHQQADIAMTSLPHSGISIPWDAIPGVETTVEPFVNQDSFNFDDSIALGSTRQATNDDGFYTSLSNLQRHPPPSTTATCFHPLGHQQFGQAATSSNYTSPSTTGREDTASQSPEPIPTKSSTNSNRKRKSPSGGSTSPASKAPRKGPKVAHNEIEKRYRMNINNRITELKNSVPSLRAMSRDAQVAGASTGGGGDDAEDDSAAPHQVKKATILAKATEYIRQLEKRNRRMEKEVEGQKARLAAFEKLAAAGRLTGFGLGDMDPHNQSFLDVDFGGNQGPIQQPLDTVRVSQQQRHHVRQPAGARGASPPKMHQGGGNRVNGRALGRLMVGSMAGLMVMEGLSEHEQSGITPTGRGLFSLPVDIFNHLRHPLSGPQGGVWWSDQGNSPLSLESLLLWAKVVLILGALIYILSPSFFDSAKKENQETTFQPSPSPTPGSRSSVSPREVRTSAWLTAMQTLDFPRLSFLQEPVAFGLAALRYCLRCLVPSHVYAFLFRQTAEQELAHTTAWRVALDAQLGGGDADLSTSRLLLTFIASASLTDTPAGLMLRALHVRILFVDQRYVLTQLARKLAKRYWNEARVLQATLMAESGAEAPSVVEKVSQIPSSDALPKHLAALLEMDCGDVMLDSILRRAHNLAWGRPTSEAIVDMDEGMDAVADDFSVRTALDALAAWWSSHTLHQALLQSIECSGSSSSGGAEAEGSSKPLSLQLRDAILVAPATSGAHLRALAAKAVLGAPESRKSSIYSALAVLPSCEIYRVQQSADLAAVSDASLVTTAGIRVALHCASSLFWARDSKPEGVRMAVGIFNGLLLDHNARGSSCTVLGPRIGLLGFVAAWKTVMTFSGDEKLRGRTKARAENVALALRVWIGGRRGKNCGLAQDQRVKIVESCLEISRMSVGGCDRDEPQV